VTLDNQKRNIAEEVAKGDDLLDTAEILQQARKHADAVSRAYYAVFHYAAALLLTAGLQAKSHGGLSRLLQSHFVKPGALSPASGTTFVKLMALRNDADYSAVGVVTDATARGELDAAIAFTTEVRARLVAGGWIAAPSQ
jgi:uncharacterized protein (UPF0332 family)